jgi:signal transduction histidine kinase
VSRGPEGTPRESIDALFEGGGEMGALMRAKDWAATPLGPPPAWPRSLRTVVRILLTSRYAMWMGWGPELSFFYNDSYRPTLGTKHAWALGSPARRVWAEIWPAIGPRIDTVLQTGQATWDEGLLLFLERSGYPEETYHTFSYSPLPDDAGAIGGMLCVVTEETERVIGERRLALLREVASGLAASSEPDEVFAAVGRCLEAEPRDLPFTLTYLFDAEGDRARLVCRAGIAEGHAAAPAMIEPGAPAAPWPVAEILARNATVEVGDLPARFRELPTGPWHRPPLQGLVVPIAQQGQARPAGAFVAALNPHRPLDGAYGSFVSLFVGQIAAGLANARAYAEERRRAEALAEIDRAKTIFFSNVSHEFRTPLTLLLGPVEDLLADPALAAAPRGQLALVHRNGLRLLKLVNALLDFSRLEAGRIRALYEPTDLAAYTSELASVFRAAVERAGLALEVDAPDLGEPVYVDRDMWEKIVLNLLSNAFKFTLDGKIAVALARDGARARLTVSDTGGGIPAAELPHLFERFHRVEGAAGRTHEGTGIGLALVQELVRLHGGTIGVESELGRGSTFVVEIPLGTAHLAADRVASEGAPAARAAGGAPFVEEALRWLPAEPRREGAEDGPFEPEAGLGLAAAGPAAAAGARERVLLADDNADMRGYLARLLAERYEVAAVGDGAQALAAARARPPALIVSDVMMPNLNGFGLLRELRADPALAGIPVVLLSARAGEEATVEGMEAGADDYLVKPFSARELLARVAAQIERKRFERALQETEERLRFALDAGRIFAWSSDLATGVTERVGEAMFAFGLAPVAPDDAFLARVHPEDRERVAAALSRARRGEGGYDEEMRVVLPDGSLRWVLDKGQLLRDAEGRPARMAGVMIDITDRKLEEERRERLLASELAARAEAERLNRMKDEFLATLSHELRTPLNAMLGWSQLLLHRDLRDPDEAHLRHGLAAIERNARAQTQMIEDLLDMSRIVSGKIRLDVQRVNLADVIEQASQSLLPAAEAKGVRLQKVLDPLAGQVAGDPGRLQQVVWNLLSNAIKFTPRGGRVQVILERVNSHLEVSVADTGRGIDPDFLPAAFDRFRQADGSSTREHGGLGLGLSIVKQLVELHGGTVRAKSPGRDRGATFSVTLPLAAAREPLADEADRRHPRAAPPWAEALVPPDLAGIKLLVVDDDRDARDLIARILAGTGATVLTAASAAEGLALVERERPDLLLSDIGMPDEDGYDLIRRLRALPAEQGGRTPAVALTAFARSEDRQRALRSGYQMHIAKPVEPAELLAVCASLTAGWVSPPG